MLSKDIVINLQLLIQVIIILDRHFIFLNNKLNEIVIVSLLISFLFTFIGGRYTLFQCDFGTNVCPDGHSR
jgi:hypothetical protein